MVTISKLSVGSMVLAYNEATDTVDLYPVTQVHEHLDPVIITLTIDDDLTDDHPGLVIETTPEHPFYVSGTWVNAEDLTVGTVLTSFDGVQGVLQRGTITSTVRVEQERMMYDLTVDTAHTFFVGKGLYLVHNTNPCPSIGELIAWGRPGHDSFVKHVLEKGDLIGLDLRTRNQLATFVDDIIANANGSNVKILNKGRTAFWDSSTGVVVIHNPNVADAGTVFRPSEGRAYFDRLR